MHAAHQAAGDSKALFLPLAPAAQAPARIGAVRRSSRCHGGGARGGGRCAANGGGVGPGWCGPPRADRVLRAWGLSEGPLNPGPLGGAAVTGGTKP